MLTEPHAASPATPPRDPRLDFRLDFWRELMSVWPYRYFIAAAAILCALGGYVQSSLARPTYRAEATVLVSEPFLPDKDRGASPFSVEAYQRLARSASIRQKLVERLREQGVIGPGDSIGALDTAIYPSREPAQVYLPLIGLTAQANSPERAEKIANAWAALFVEEEQRLVEMTKGASVDFVITEFAKASATVLEQQRRLHSVKEQQSQALTNLKTRAAIDLKRAQIQGAERTLVEFETTLYRTRVDRQMVEQRMNQLQASLKNTAPLITLAKGLSDEGIWAAVVGGKPLPAGAQNTQLRSEEINPVYTRLAEEAALEAAQYHALAAREQSLTTQLAALRQSLGRTRSELLAAEFQVANLEAQNQVEAGVPQRAVDEAQARFKKLEERVGAAQLAKADQTSSRLRVGALASSAARTSSGARSPVIFGLIGLMVAVAVAWFWERLKQARTRLEISTQQRLQRVGVNRSTDGA